MNITLTSEQAAYLEQLLESKLSDFHWNPRERGLDEDDHEHCETILHKVRYIRQAGRW